MCFKSWTLIVKSFIIKGMKISFKKPLMLSLVLFVFLFSFSLWTQKANAEDEDIDTYFATTTNASCADYYHFNGVQIDVKPSIIQSVAGADMNFSGSILNNNEYPVVSGRLFVKIFRDRSTKDNNGPDVLDAFVAQDGLSIKAGEKIPVNFKWKIPAYALGGDYKIATYFITSDKFNLAGLSFTDDVVAGLSSFKVLGQQDKGVFLKKDGVKVNNSTYAFAAYPPIQSPIDPVTITVPVTNTTAERVAVKVEFNVYKWDAQSSENKIDTSTKVAVIEPGKTIYMPMVINDNKSSVYYTEVVLKYMDSKSILGIRFVRNGVTMPRINFPSISSYPLVSGQKNNIFACFHNASNSNAPIDGKLKIDILGEDNNPILSYEYDGKIIGEMSAVKQEFVPRSTYKDFKIHASLFEGSKLVDEVYIPYSCKEIDPNNCGFNFGDISSSKWLKLVLEIVGLLILIGLIVLFAKRSNKFKEWYSKLRINRVKTFLFVLLLIMFMGSGSRAHAAAQFTLTVTNYNPSSGTVSYTPNQANYANGTNVTITAYPNSGYSVSYFNGGGCPTNPANNTCVVKVTGNITVYVSMNQTASGSGSSSGNSSGSASGSSGSGVAAGCFTISTTNPQNTTTCNLWHSTLNPTNDCSVNNQVTVDVTGTNLMKVGYSSMGGYPVKIFNQTDNSMSISFERLSGELAQKISFADTKFFSKCTGFGAITFACKMPTITSITPVFGPTSGGTLVTVTGTNFNNAKSVKIGHVTVSKANTTIINDNTLTFVTPAEAPGWKSVSVQGNCWQSKFRNSDAVLPNAFNYQKNLKNPPFPPDDVWNWDGNYNTGSVSITNPYLYYWATTSLTSNLDGGSWAKALGDNNAQINYDSSVTYSDSGVVVQDQAVIPAGTKLHFNFDGSTISSSPSHASQKISWNGTGFTEDTPYGSWVDDAAYPDQVCTNDNFVTSQTVIDPSSGLMRSADIFIPLSVNPPGQELSFTTSTYSVNTDTTEWGAPPIKSTDSASWSCDSPDSSSPICTPVVGGIKKINMFYAPTYGYYYYGWRWTNQPSGVCHTNNIALNQKKQLVVNNGALPQYDLGSGTCIAGALGCTKTFSDSYGNVVMCSKTYPYYNPETNHCYSNISDWVASLHTDLNIPGQNFLADYYYPYKLKFRESVYSLNLSVIATSTTENRTPSEPVITGPKTISANVPATFSAVSNLVVAKSKSNSMLASAIFAIKKLFAQAEDPQVYYLFDWNGDGASDYVSNNVSYGTNVSASFTWGSLGLKRFAVKAVDKTSLNSSNWKTFDVTVASSTDDITLTPPVISGTYCGSNVTLAWDQVTNADGYSLYKNSGNYFADISGGSVISTIDTYYSASSDSYYMYAYKLPTTSTTTVTTYTSPTVWTSHSSVKNWISITSSSDGQNLAAVVYGGYIYTSTDSGVTWTARMTDATRYWRSITSSTDGKNLAAVVSSSGYIYTSTDYGATWTPRMTDATRSWYSITSSSDGQNLAAVVYGGYIYTSTDYGANWIKKTSDAARNWWSITSSADGSKLAAAVSGGYIYTSTNSGATWATSTSAGSKSWVSITTDVYGNNLAAAVNNGYLYISSDFGSTWSAKMSDMSRNWYSIDSSSDGTKLIAGISGGNIYTSSDSGSNWSPSTTVAGYSVTNSADGIKLAAVNYGGYIYTSAYNSSTTYVGTTTNPISSVQSNTLNSSSITKLCTATTTTTTSTNLGIKSGIKFFAKPNWADNNNQCTFWGSVDTTVVDDSNTTYTNVAPQRCYIDSDTPANVINNPSTSPAQLTFTGGGPAKKGLGKRIMYCDISFAGLDSENKPITAFASTTMESKCSKLPNTIEK